MIERGESVALVELDRIAEMALPTLPSWEVARQIFGSVAGQWVRSGVTCVIAEGVGSAGEVDELLQHAPSGAVTVRVVTTTSFEKAVDAWRVARARLPCSGVRAVAGTPACDAPGHPARHRRANNR
jgi:hypothetical protein